MNDQYCACCMIRADHLVAIGTIDGRPVYQYCASHQVHDAETGVPLGAREVGENFDAPGIRPQRVILTQHPSKGLVCQRHNK